jgi:hypothetical protein
MAKSWSGFLPQNETIIAQWNVLEATQGQIEALLEAIPPMEDFDNGECEEEKLPAIHPGKG